MPDFQEPIIKSVDLSAMKFMPSDDTIDPGPPAFDALILRTPEMDGFFRKIDVDKGEILYEEPKIPQEFTSNKLYDPELYDEKVRDGIKAQHQQPWLLDSLTLIGVQFVNLTTGELRNGLGSGIIMSPRIVFTAAHLFRPDDGFEVDFIQVMPSLVSLKKINRPFFKAKRLPIDQGHIMNYRTPKKRKWIKETIDFAVLQTEEHMPVESNKLLKIFEETSYKEGTVICAAGYLKEDRRDITGFFTSSLLDLMEDSGILTEDRELKLRTLYRENAFEFEAPIVGFGALIEVSDPNRFYYAESNHSALGGMSGGPVIAMEAPDTLIGITVGGFSHEPTAVFLSAHCPPVLKAYEQYVKHSV